jgi:hypothetical protein
MQRQLSRRRAEARRLYLAGEASSNAEIAVKLRVKPHTIGRWRKEEDWDGLRLKIDRRAAEMFVEKIATDRVSLNVRHFRFWDLMLAKLAEDLKAQKTLDIREMERVAGILERAQKGQRLAKGMSLGGETEEALRAQGQAEIRRLVDTFVETVKECVPDEQTREKIRQCILGALPAPEDDGAGVAEDALGE